MFSYTLTIKSLSSFCYQNAEKSYNHFNGSRKPTSKNAIFTPDFLKKKKSNLETKNNSEFPKPKRGIANIIFIGERITCFLLK